MILAVVMAVVAAACGGDSPGAGDAAVGDPEAIERLEADSTTTTGVGAPPSGQSGTQSRQTVPRRGPTAAAPAGGAEADGGAAEDAVDRVYAASRRGNGDFAGPLLRPAPKGARRIVFQLMVQSGKGPAQSTVDHVVSTLRRVSGKTVEVRTVALPAGPNEWSVAELHSYADRYSQTKSSVDAAVLNVLFVAGSFEQGENVLGAASRADVVTMFPDQYRNLGAGLSPQSIETSVVMHETGHILGLVGHLVRAERQDPDHPGHSRNKASVMYWAVETDDIISAFVGAPPKELDRDDLMDLELIRNG